MPLLLPESPQPSEEDRLPEDVDFDPNQSNLEDLFGNQDLPRIIDMATTSYMAGRWRCRDFVISRGDPYL